MRSRLFGWVVAGLLLLYYLTLVLHISANYEQYQWDFRTHRQAGLIFAAGENPYDPQILSGKAGTRLLYTYPPATLFFYRLLALTDYRTAFHIFLFIKSILLIGLIYFWKREFLEQEADAFFFIFCLLAFNTAVYRDIIAGNINLVEEAFLWLGFWFFMKHRLALFCMSILMAASFKMIPIVFLGLLLLAEDRRKFWYLSGAAAVFLIYLLIQYWAAPQLFAGFIRNASEVVAERGALAPSTFTLLRDVFQFLGKNMGLDVPPAGRIAVVVVLAAVVFFLTVKAHVRLKQLQSENTEKTEVFLACLVYALIHPRFKDYAYVLLLVPAYYIIKNAGSVRPFGFIFILCIFSVRDFVLPGTGFLFGLFWEYYPLMLAYGIWAIYLYEIKRNFLPAENYVENKSTSRSSVQQNRRRRGGRAPGLGS
jgi:hypothetical protein